MGVGEDPKQPEEAKKQPNDGQIALEKFCALNAWSAVSVEGKFIVVDKPWGTSDLRLRVASDDAERLKDLNSVVLNPCFDAIFHADESIFEFIFSYVDPSEEIAKDYLDRKFTVHYGGVEYECEFAKPTDRLQRLSKCSESLPFETSGLRVVPQLAMYRDAQNIEKLGARAKEWFAKRVPRSFFVRPKTQITLSTQAAQALFRHINLLMRYYDRYSPSINVRDEQPTARSPEQRPLRAIEPAFPTNLAINPVEDIVLRLLEVARGSPPRLAFVYHYQVLEYVGYYYLDEKIKKSLRSLLRDPTVINCGDDHIGELISIFAESGHNDDAKMQRVIEDHCDPKVIWKELDHHKAFFCAEQLFEGGFTLAPIISADTTADSWRPMWVPKTYTALTKVRNALVHARERRENKVILPTEANNLKVRYINPLMQRIAEQLALKGG